ncbi:MAG: Gfo/Idh/MocA family oxidoreductase [Lachnospiraceae bacterium]|nr:Gfo/Idh/MocA family oxidoreductase [Lachnospiraceae bacterium]
MVRIGILGCGYFGAEFARAVKEQNGMELVAVYSPGNSAERVSRELGCGRAERMEDILEDAAIDAIIVATPNYLHHQHVLMAAEAGKHIFCEKPFALSWKDAAEMANACRNAHVTLMVGHIMHFYPGIAEVKAMVERGEFGEILTMHIERTGWEQKKAAVSWKKMQDQSGGHLFHHIHELDILQWIMGVPVEIYGVGGNLGHQEGGFGDEDDVLLLTARFRNGMFATMQYGSGFRVGNHVIRINGSRLGAVIDFKEAEVCLVDDQGKRRLPLFQDDGSAEAIKALFRRTDGGISYGSPQERPPQYILTALRKELRLFCQVIEGREIPPEYADLFDGTSAVNSVQIAELGLRARRNGKPVGAE